MKQNITICAAIFLAASMLLPQQASAQAPQKMSYQAVIRNSSNALITTTPVGMRISILQGNISGASVYVETQTVSTNANGLVSLEIGNGTQVSGSFTGINWANGPYFIKTETDPKGGTSYTISGTSELMSVPYALFSANGTPGPQGPAGAVGATGPQGPIGLTGPAGVTGPQGTIGLTGPAGPIGLTGPAGAAGANGNGFTNGTVVNQMKYWNGSAWVDLNPGSNGQVLSICGGSLTWVTMAGVCAPSIPTYPSGSVFCASEASMVVAVTNPSTGKIWMDRNLGANKVANSSTDAESHGDLYQWGRRSDGHQCRNSSTTLTLSSTDQPAHGSFILTPILTPNPPLDWRNPQNINLWQGVNGINNPCPSGYRLPTTAELNSERLSWSSNNAAGAFASPLKLPLPGFRYSNDGTLDFIGSYGYYWSSTVNGTNSNDLFFNSGSAYTGPGNRARGSSVRCIKE